MEIFGATKHQNVFTYVAWVVNIKRDTVFVVMPQTAISRSSDQTRNISLLLASGLGPHEMGSNSVKGVNLNTSRIIARIQTTDTAYAWP